MNRCTTSQLAIAYERNNLLDIIKEESKSHGEEKERKRKENNLKKGFISSFEELTTTENINVICFTLQVFEWYAHHNALRGTKKINIDSGYHGNAGDVWFRVPG